MAMVQNYPALHISQYGIMPVEPTKLEQMLGENEILRAWQNKMLGIWWR